MYPNGYVPQQPQERRRRSERYAPQSVPQAVPPQGRPQPVQSQQAAPMMRGYQPPKQPQAQPVSPRGVPHAAQNIPQQYPPQPNQQWNNPQQNYGRGYYPAGQGQRIAPKENVPRQTKPNNGNTTGGKKPPKVNWKLLLILLAVAVIAAVGGVAGFNAHELQQLEDYVSTYDNVFCNNVYVDGIHLGGMTQQQAVEAVTNKAQQRNDAWSVKLMLQGQLVTEIDASQLGMRVDVMEQLRQAWDQGHMGTAQERMAAMEALAKNPYQAYSALPSGDTSVVDSMLADISRRIYRAPQDARILEFNPQKSSDPFTYQPEVVGISLDVSAVKEQIYHMVSTLESGSIELEPTMIQPQVTQEELKKTVTLRASAVTKISTTSTENRTNNIRRAFQLISGTIIQPGETFSFNGIVGARSVENGFYEAIEYAYNEQVMGIGGGVCQASTTVFQAAVEAGMQITHREQHSLEVNYCDLGKDATVYWSKNRKIDLTFKNTTDGPIYIVAAVQSDPDKRSRLISKVSIYGPDMGDTEYKLESKVVEVLQPPTEEKIVKDKKQQYVTYVDEQKVVQKAEEGCIVEGYRVKYVGGEEVERALMHTDRYEPKQKTIYVGVKQR